MSRGRITKFIVDGKDYFAAMLDTGWIRIGLLNDICFEFNSSHDEYHKVLTYTTESEIEELHDQCMSIYFK